MDIGFIGLGAMGSAIAGNLIKAGHRVTVWNRSPGPFAALTAQGAVVAQSPEQTLQGDVLFSMLAHDEAMRGVGLDGGLLDSAAKGLIHANLATISVAFAETLAKAHAARGLAYVSAPVFGRPPTAAAAQLVITAAGDTQGLATLQPLFAAIGRRTIVVGRDAARANLFKIAGNFLIASALDSMSEAFVLLRKGGVDPALFHEFLIDALFPGPVYANYGRLVLEQKFEPPGFHLKLGLKDVRLAQEAANCLAMSLPIGNVLENHLQKAVAAGLGDKDWTSVSSLIAKEAGL
jgi:3-hydroxyisobutyrate dehydrogenase-like beta-hydroxyacid dehydrogenase